ncbi:acetate--CoA ligase [Microbacterium sp. Clip185]|uniref:acetate--CoA ligase n=1 Tax=Microbacterium sp. Clip185 TaxID=3025663 RepID=UPI002365E50B|nr:acetate--CoA ligase [Microbacterium sp. Clip185]WDG17133.1 acetate--CoA ligase [Microbacterium sp. Clip185]
MSTPTTASAHDDTIRSLLEERRTFAPPVDFAERANVTEEWIRREWIERAGQDPETFWTHRAEILDWAEPWHTAHRWEPTDGESIPSAEWFAGGRLNASVNAVDRHVAAGHGDRVAFHFEGEPGDRRTITYAELQREVAKAANALTAMGIGKGDRVVVYLPVLVETVVIQLAVARIGAIHSLVFGGFSAEAVRFRVEDTQAKLLVTTDGQFRRGAAVPVKHQADAAVARVDSIEHVLVIRRTGDEVAWTEGRDLWWHETVDTAPDTHEPEFFDAETPLFIIYTSGTTGKPKGLVHTTGGWLTHVAWTYWAVFDAKPETDVYWCTADLAWVTAHSYETYGPLLNGVTSVLYEGTPDTPGWERHFQILERYGVTTYYTAPTLIRSLMSRFPDGPPSHYDLSALRLLGTVGEAINPEAWIWFHRHLGRGETPVVDTWWQSETGGAIAAPLPGVSTLKPGSALTALPGLRVRVVDAEGTDVGPGGGGLLVVDCTWPGMSRTVWGNPERYRDSYWKRFAAHGYFLAGDGAKLDEDGDLWVLGRVDDVINVSGHRLSTIEIESALVAHPEVGEAAVVGVADDVTGQAIAAFVTNAEDAAALRQHVRTVIGPVAQPTYIFTVPDLPKTRSGKIMRRLLVDLVDGRPLGDTTSLQDETVPPRIAEIVRVALRR